MMTLGAILLKTMTTVRIILIVVGVGVLAVAIILKKRG